MTHLTKEEADALDSGVLDLMTSYTLQPDKHCHHCFAKDIEIADLKAQVERREKTNDSRLLQMQRIEKENSDLEAQVAECMLMLDNVRYWDTCPDDYIERIKKLQAKDGE